MNNLVIKNVEIIKTRILKKNQVFNFVFILNVYFKSKNERFVDKNMFSFILSKMFNVF